MNHQHSPFSVVDGVLQESIEIFFGRLEIQTMQIHMTLDGKIPTMNASENLRRQPSCRAFNIFSSVSENESITGLNQFAELLDDFSIGIFRHPRINML